MTCVVLVANRHLTGSSAGWWPARRCTATPRRRTINHDTRSHPSHATASGTADEPVCSRRPRHPGAEASKARSPPRGLGRAAAHAAQTRCCTLVDGWDAARAFVMNRPVTALRATVLAFRRDPRDAVSEGDQAADLRGAGGARTHDRRIVSEARSRCAPVLTSGFSGAPLLMTGTRGIGWHHFAPRMIPRRVGPEGPAGTLRGKQAHRAVRVPSRVTPGTLTSW